jgi:hypothetical protein
MKIVKKDLPKSELILQALTTKNYGKAHKVLSHDPFMQPGTRVVDYIFIEHIEKVLGVTEYVGSHVGHARTNEKLAAAFIKLNEMYEIKLRSGNMRFEPLNMTAKTFRALAYAAQEAGEIGHSLLEDIKEILVQGIDLMETDPYFEVRKISDRDNDGPIEQYFEIKPSGVDLKLMEAKLNYKGIQTQALAKITHVAKERACEKWLIEYSKK